MSAYPNQHQSFIIATTPRTGSFLLSEGLAATGVAGVPQEYAAIGDVTSWRDFHGFSTHAQYFFSFPDLCRSSNGVCGVKLMWPQFLAWEGDARRYLGNRASPESTIRGMTGGLRIVRLVRRDSLRQAISWVRARRTGVWSRRHTDPAPVGETEMPSYDLSAIQQAVLLLDRQNRNWDGLVSRSGAPTLTVFYEDLAADFASTIGQVLSFLALPKDAVSSETPKLARQSDEITEDWVVRAQRDLGLPI